MSEPREDDVNPAPFEEGSLLPGPLDYSYSDQELDYNQSLPRRDSVLALPDSPTPATYKITTGSVDMAGPRFEIKMAALFLLRGLERKTVFSLMSNAKAAGLFDDVTYGERVTAPSFMLQLKHKQNDTIHANQLLSTTGDFSLLKYLDSFRKIKESFAKESEDFNKHFGTFDNLKFVIFTTACMDKRLYENENEVINVENDEFGTGGKRFSINKDGDISMKLKEISKFRKFLETLKSNTVDGDGNVLKQMANESEEAWQHSEVRAKFDELKKNLCMEQLNETLKWKAFGLVTDDATCEEFLGKLLICTDQPKESGLDEIIMRKIKLVWFSDEHKTQTVFEALIKGLTVWWEKRGSNRVLDANTRIWTNALLEGKRQKLESLDVEFVDSSIETLRQTIKTSNLNLVILKRSLTSLTSIRLLQCLNDQTSAGLDKTIFVDLNELIGETKKVIAAWKSMWCDTLVVECGMDLSPREAKGLEEQLTEVAKQKTKRIVLISKEGNALVNAMRTFTQSEEHEDDFKWADLTEKSRETLRSKTLSFQGEKVTLNDLIGNRDKLASALDGVTLELLVKGELQLGRVVRDPIDRNVSRSLRTADGLRAVRVCSDVLDNMVLVTGPPGMGKSTLLTELGKATKKAAPLLWVVRLNLTECSEYLKKLDLEDITDGIHFLQQFSYHLKTRFEEALFLYCLNEKELVLLLDGYDEISPCYDEKMLKILEELSKGNLNKLWVTSRSVTKEIIEQTLDIKQSELMPFTRKDQSRFLVEYWQSVYTDIDLNCTKEFAKSLLKLTDETFTDDNFLTGVPLLVAMMAEIYEKDLVQYYQTYQTSKTFPETLDLLTLYDSFVKRKHEIYYRDKKKLDSSIPANENDKDNDFQKFMKNHIQASLVSLLHPDDYKDLLMENRNQTEDDLIAKIRSGVEKTGIIDGIDPQNQIRFIHRTFCEYFLAKWLSENYKHVCQLLRKIASDSSFKVVNDILNRILSRESRLHVCVLNRDLNRIKQLLDLNPESVDARDAGGRTALLLLSSVWDDRHDSTYDAIGRLLLDRGASIGVTDRVFNHTPLRFADRNRAWTLAGMILNKGGKTSDMPVTTNYMNDIVFVEFIEFIQAPNVSTGNGSKLMELAAKHGHTCLVQYLIEKHYFSVQFRQKNDVTLMHHAAQSGNLNLMIYLNKNGISYTCKDGFNNVPLHYAAQAGRSTAVEYLIKNGCDVDARNNACATPLLVASGSPDADEEVIKCLMEHGADVNAFAYDNTSALSSAAKNGKLETVKCLVRQGVDVTKYGQAAIQSARENQRGGVVRFLEQINNNLPAMHKSHVAITFSKRSIVKCVFFVITLLVIVILYKPSVELMSHFISTVYPNKRKIVMGTTCWLIFQCVIGMKVIKTTKVKYDWADIIVWFALVIWSGEKMIICLIIEDDHFLFIDLAWLIVQHTMERFPDFFQGNRAFNPSLILLWLSGVLIWSHALFLLRTQFMMSSLLTLASGLGITLGLALQGNGRQWKVHQIVGYVGMTVCCTGLGYLSFVTAMTPLPLVLPWIKWSLGVSALGVLACLVGATCSFHLKWDKWGEQCIISALVLQIWLVMTAYIFLLFDQDYLVILTMTGYYVQCISVFYIN